MKSLSHTSSNKSNGSIFTKADESEKVISRSNTASPISIENTHLTKSERDSLLFRLDLVLAPTIMILYLVAFLDRSNIGNAKVAGLPEDLKLKGDQFNIIASVFYVTFILFEMPTTLLMKKVQPKRMLAFIVISYSLTTIFTGFCHNFGGLLAARLVLGFCEAGLFPCLALYLTMVYSRVELAPRIAYLFASSALSGAFGGLFAYAVLHMDGVGGFAGWRWLFIIEGLIGFVCGVAVYFIIPNDITKAWFLSKTHQEMMRKRQLERAADLEAAHFDWKGVKSAFTDFKVYLYALSEFGQDTCLYGFSTFLPAIISGMGYTSLSVQYMTIPVYISGAVTYIAASFLSDRFHYRGIILIIGNIFPIVGYILLLACQNNKSVLYFACYLCSVGVYTGAGLNVTWLSANIAPHYKRATAISLQLAIANSSGILAGQIYRYPPKYIAGHLTSLIAIFISTVLHVVNIFFLKHQNSKKQKSLASSSTIDLSEQPKDDKDARFHYIL